MTSGTATDPRRWVQIAVALLDRIADGDLKPGDRVPEQAAAGREHGASKTTAFRAYRELARWGVIRKDGRGYHVRADAAAGAGAVLKGGRP